MDSAIIDLKPQKVLRKRIHDVQFFHHLVRDIFVHRRKFLRSALISATKPRLTKIDVDSLLEELGFSEKTRAEQLLPQQLIVLADAVKRRMEELAPQGEL